ncbi:MAG TPA: hypothetical protein VGD98_04580 [Ktedonobacteraceae bacterium]
MIWSAESEALPRVTLWTLDLDQPLPPGPVPQVSAIFTRARPEVAQELARAMDLDRPTTVLQRFARAALLYRQDRKHIGELWLDHF